MPAHAVGWMKELYEQVEIVDAEGVQIGYWDGGGDSGTVSIDYKGLDPDLADKIGNAVYSILNYGSWADGGDRHLCGNVVLKADGLHCVGEEQYENRTIGESEYDEDTGNDRIVAPDASSYVSRILITVPEELRSLIREIGIVVLYYITDTMDVGEMLSNTNPDETPHNGLDTFWKGDEQARDEPLVGVRIEFEDGPIPDLSSFVDAIYDKVIMAVGRLPAEGPCDDQELLYYRSQPVAGGRDRPWRQEQLNKPLEFLLVGYGARVNRLEHILYPDGVVKRDEGDCDSYYTKPPARINLMTGAAVDADGEDVAEEY
jgi:hypothetical protein